MKLKLVNFIFVIIFCYLIFLVFLIFKIHTERVQALYAFNAQRNDEISFEKDDIIRVLSKTDPTWWRGHNIRTNAVGLFPSNHVQPVSNNDGGGGGGGNSDITSSSCKFFFFFVPRKRAN